MITNVLPQLRAVEAELASEVEALTSQLEAAKEKLDGIQTVIEMYSEKESGSVDDSSETAVKAPKADAADAEEAPTANAEATSPVEASKADAADVEEAPTAEAEATSPVEAPAKGKSKAKKTSTSKKATSPKSAKKKDGRTASWQKYTRPGVKNESIPDAVRIILETQPDKDFKIAEVMDALFKEGMPKAQYLKARNRISNVLSGGVRAGDWYKGERGTYRMTAA